MDLPIRHLTVAGALHRYCAVADLLPGIRLPVSIAMLMENCVRHGGMVDVEPFRHWVDGNLDGAIARFHPERVLLPDSSGVPLLADLAAMRDAVAVAGGDPAKVEPAVPIDVVIDHSIVVDHAGTPDAADRNLALEYARNAERYGFLRWANDAMAKVRVLAPGNGIIHQINAEALAKPVHVAGGTTPLLHPDSLVGGDSHTPMVNALGILGWGVGGIEATSVALGAALEMRIPEVVECRLMGARGVGITATDLVLMITRRLRAFGVVNRFVEFTGAGAAGLSLPDRATIANMAPEYGATMGFFAPDTKTMAYFLATGRDPAEVAAAEALARAQDWWADGTGAPREYSACIEIDLGDAAPAVAGPHLPDRLQTLSRVPASFIGAYPQLACRSAPSGIDRALADGDIVLAAISSCTSTSNPALLAGAGLLARNARARGLKPRPWVKTSFSPGSRATSDFLARVGLLEDLEALGFGVVGYGCMTCSGASGPLAPAITSAITGRGLTVVAVQSSNRNFEGRVHPQVGPCYLASPALVVAYALAGSILVDLANEPLGHAPDGIPVTLADLWPSDEEIAAFAHDALQPDLMRKAYAGMLDGDNRWRALRPAPVSPRFDWDPHSSYLRPPPYFGGEATEPGDISGARALLLLGDGVTTDHISPTAPVPFGSDAGHYLERRGVTEEALGSYLTRRGNHEVMIRGTFASTRLANRMVGRLGGIARHEPDGVFASVYTVAAQYAREGVPLVVIAGRDYGIGSSRDWAAKGTRLLGIRAVIACGFERIHRSNLVGMGVLPLEFSAGDDPKSLALDGTERFDLLGLEGLTPHGEVQLSIRRNNGSVTQSRLLVRIETPLELDWYRAGGVLRAALHPFMPA